MHLSIKALSGVVTLSLMTAASAHAQQTTAQPSRTVAPASTPTAVTTTTTAGQAPASTTTTTAGVVPVGAQVVDRPAMETTESPINRPLMVTGAIFLVGTYGASAIDAATSSRESDKNNLYYPVVGPWMDYADRGGCPATGSCAGETGNKVLLILDGVGQGLGALAIVTSLFIPEKTTRTWYLIGSSGLHAAPSRVGTGYGLGAGGMF